MNDTRSFSSDESSIAIVGLAGRFPGAPDLDTFWANLVRGVESIRSYSDDELLESGVSQEDLSDPSYVKVASTIDGADLFDADYFHYSPKEAELMDPQQRIFLECALEALESSGCNPAAYEGAIGVFGGAAVSLYQHWLSPASLREIRSSGTLRTLFIHGNDKDYLPTRVSYKLNLRGPSIAIQTACSTSLVAVHVACQSLHLGECDLALAGGVSIQYSFRKRGYRYIEGGIFSPDGRCRPFDAAARGTVFGDGVGIVALKRLDRALADGDPIRAIIKGSAVNNDGSGKVGFTAPSVDGQSAVITEALAVAGVSPEAISYIETHGTGTELGDPIEVAALTQVFRSTTDQEHLCRIGSLKSNVGHLNTAAGVAGLIKTVLALEHASLPPSLNFTVPNPKIDFAGSPFCVNTELTDWPRISNPRRAGVSSFGIGGTNAHVIVEEPPRVISQPSARTWHALPLSGRSSDAVNAATMNLAEHLRARPDANVADIAFTLGTGRVSHDERRVIICRDIAEAVDLLDTLGSRQVMSGRPESARPSVAFMFSGQGSQYLHMGRGLYEREPIFRFEIDRCAESIKSHLQLDLRQVLFPNEEEAANAGRQLTETEFAQPAIFAICYALAKVWMHWGVRPSALIGHSIGELVAACIAGVLTPEDALSVVAARGALMQALPKGVMLAVPITLREIEPFLNADVSVAAANGPAACVVSGPPKAMTEFERTLQHSGVFCKKLRTSHAFHSSMMEPAVGPFVEVLNRIELRPPTIPFISNVTATWITNDEATDPDYWGRHLRATVRFGEGVALLTRESPGIMLEVGPGETLTGLARYNAAEGTKVTAVPSLPQTRDPVQEPEMLLRAAARVWIAGGPVDWGKLYHNEKRVKVPLPTYPFERRRYWLESSGSAAGNEQPQARLNSLDTAFRALSWKRMVKRAPATSAEEGGANWLVFIGGNVLDAEFVSLLRSRGENVTEVRLGGDFERLDMSTFVLAPDQPAQFRRLFSKLRETGRLPQSVVYLWSIVSQREVERDVKAAIDRSFFGLMHLLQTLGEATTPVRLAAVTVNAQNVLGEERVVPLPAIARGPCLVGSLEYDNVSACLVDIARSDLTAANRSRFLARLIDQLAQPAPAPIVAYRGSQAWVPTLEPITLDRRSPSETPLRPGGAYLITGGLGGLGITIARSMAERCPVKLVLIGRSALPDRREWDEHLAAGSLSEKKLAVMRRVQEIEQLGSEVMIASADVAKLSRVWEVVRQAQARFGDIHGVVHAAGVGAIEPIISKTRERALPVLNPKIVGTLVLDRVFRGKSLDFFVSFSSISSLAGFIGHVDYCAANAFLDAFSESKNSFHCGNVISINWDAWRDIGLGARKNAALPDQLKATRAEYLKDSITSEEGIDAFFRILSGGIARIGVLKHELPASIARSTEQPQETPGREQSPPPTESAPPKVEAPVSKRVAAGPRRYPRPSLRTEYVAASSELEDVIAGLWAELLNLEQIGVNDDFFELGGHSLLALQLIPRLRNRFQTEVSVQDIFETPTVSGLALLIEEKLIREIEQMGDKEAASAVAA